MRILKSFTKPYRLKDYKFGLVISVIALSIIGIFVVGSAKEVYQSRQMVGVIIGIIMMIIVSHIYVLTYRQ